MNIVFFFCFFLYVKCDNHGLQWVYNLSNPSFYVLDSLSQAAWFSLYFWNMYFMILMYDVWFWQNARPKMLCNVTNLRSFSLCMLVRHKTNAFLHVAQSFAQWSETHWFHLLLRYITVHCSVHSCVLFCFLKVSHNEDHFHSLRLPLHQA